MPMVFYPIKAWFLNILCEKKITNSSTKVAKVGVISLFELYVISDVINSTFFAKVVVIPLFELYKSFPTYII